MLNLEKICALDVAQKSKVTSSVEGDENSRFFHAILNKRRRQMLICGISLDGE